MVKPLGLLVVLTVGIFAVGCAYTFTTSLNQSGGGAVSVTNFKLTSTGSCFVDGQTNETGSFTAQR